jgi:GWxTD domain-containing protein
MKTIFFTIIFFLSSFTLFAQEEQNTLIKRKLGEAVYFQDFLNFISDKPGDTRIDVFIQVPYKNVVFVKSNEGFTAKYSVTASIFDSTKSTLLLEKTWTETVNVFDYYAARAKDNYNLSKKSFELKPGTYSVRTTLEDLDSRKIAKSEIPLIVRDLSGNISVSDILLISKNDNSQPNNTIVPNISRNIASPKDRIKIYFEIYSKDSSETRLHIDYKVINSEDTLIYKEEDEDTIKTGVNQMYYTMAEFPFELGAYVVSATVRDDQNKEIATVKKAFYSHSVGLPFAITDIDKAIAQTRYIANPSEIDYMEEGKNNAEKTKRFLAFWKKRDPSPNNEENEIFDEYFKRVAYADENFSNYIDGWKTDRGMVFILLGPANNIDRHPFELDSKPYEVWEYYDLNYNLVFVDETGFGDYRLVTPLPGEYYRFRY